MNITTATPAKNLRVARCTSGHGYFAWPGSDPIGCLTCGKNLATTTRQQRQQPWRVLDREEARQASRLQGGLPDLIRWTRVDLDTSLERVARALVDDEVEVRLLDETDRWANWQAGDRVAKSGRYSTFNLDASLRHADKTIAKIARLQRKLDKLGGPVTEPHLIDA